MTSARSSPWRSAKKIGVAKIRRPKLSASRRLPLREFSLTSVDGRGLSVSCKVGTRKNAQTVRFSAITQTDFLRFH